MQCNSLLAILQVEEKNPRQTARCVHFCDSGEVLVYD